MFDLSESSQNGPLKTKQTVELHCAKEEEALCTSFYLISFPLAVSRDGFDIVWVTVTAEVSLLYWFQPHSFNLRDQRAVSRFGLAVRR